MKTMSECNCNCQPPAASKVELVFQFAGDRDTELTDRETENLVAEVTDHLVAIHKVRRRLT